MVENNVIEVVELPPDAPRAESEHDMLVWFLDYYRAVLLRQTAGLSGAQLDVGVGATTLTLGRLLRHMAFVEDHWFGHVLLGAEYDDEWAGADWNAQPDWEMDTAADYSPTELAEQFERFVAASRDAIAGRSLDTIAVREGPAGPTSLRWILIHMIEEYARHCGHADLIREAVDGRTGD